MTDATIDLRNYTESQHGGLDPRVRTGILTMVGAAAGTAGIAALASGGRLDLHLLAVCVLANASALCTLVAFISLTTRSASAQLRQQIVGDIVAQVSAVVATRVANTLAAEFGRAAGRQDGLAHLEALTREVARQRGQLNRGLGELAEAVQRVEAAVKADIAVAYDLGAQSARN